MKRTAYPIGWLALAVLLVACEPSPSFSTPEQPVVGQILAESSAIASAGDQHIRLLYEQTMDTYRVRVPVPGGTYPAGTRVTIRLVRILGSLGDVGRAMNDIVGTTFGWFTALQLLPAGLIPALPLRVELSHVGYVEDTLELLHAYEGDQGWKSVGTVNTGGETVAFDIDRPGLWSMVPYVLPVELARPLQRTGVTCERGIVADPLPVLLDLSNDTYVWTRVSAEGCRSTETGPIGRLDSPYFIRLSMEVSLEVSPGNTGLTLSFTGDTAECGRNSYVSESYAPAPANSLDLLPPVPTDCPTADGGQPDVGRD